MYGTDKISFLTISKKENPYAPLSEFKTFSFEQTLDSVRVLINEFSFS